MKILITGGSSGLGKATVELLAKEGVHEIWATYFSNKEAADQLCTDYPRVKMIKTDFSNPGDIDSLCACIAENDIDVLINNAYNGQPGGVHFHKTKPAEFKEGFELNVLPVITITQAAIEVFKKKKFGKIITVLTEAIHGLPPAGYAIYMANKSYLWALSKVWSKEYIRFNITANCISPAYMTTDFANIDERITEQMAMSHPLKKLLSPLEAAQSIKFFVDASQQVNAVDMIINAGQILS